MLNQAQFRVLTYIEEKREVPSQRVLASDIGVSLGTINKTANELIEIKYINKNSITDLGLKALEPYRVKRAVIMAAGFGSRLVPITLNTPKPLVRVHGKRIIDSLLDAIVAAGIEEIIIVRGYLKEQFEDLKFKYPNIRYIDNEIFNEANNISSMLCARDLLQNAYVCEADLLVRNPKIITKYQYNSNYLAIPVATTDDWCFFTKNGRIVKLGIGGRNCSQMVGVSYWDEEDGNKLKEHIKNVYEMPGGKERFWDQVPLEFFINEYDVAIRECSTKDIIEIDTFKELKAIDSSYNI
jgi:CTP:phosphocholine cytidylyltransferase-like protein